MVPLVKNSRTIRPIRRRDFAMSDHVAPQVTRRLSRAYYKKSKPVWRKWLFLSITVFVVGFAIALMYSPIFTIKNVVINNVGFKPTEDRLSQILRDVMATRRWYILPQSNLIFFSSKVARELLASEFYIEEVDFIRHWPNVLKINVAKNVIAAVLKTDNGQFLVDRRGVLVQQIQSESDEVSKLPLVVERSGPVRNLGDEAIKPEIVNFIDDMYSNWQTQLPDLLPQYIVLDALALPTLQVNIPEGWYVNVTGESSPSSQIESLKRLLEERIKDDRTKLQYIDVRFGNRLYFKLK